MYEFVFNLINNTGLGNGISRLITYAIIITVTVALSALAKFITKKALDYYAHKIAAKTVTKVDDLLIEYRVIHAFTWITPLLVIYIMAPIIKDYHVLLRDFAISFIVICINIAVFRALNAVVDVMRKKNYSHGGTLKSIMQVIKIVLIVLSTLVIIVTFMGDDVAWAIFSSVGGLSALLLLIFKDSILGLVAGFQLSSEGLLKLGDWLQMDKYNADGEVVDMSLTKVIVRNWDKTYTTIPAYRFLEDSFTNFQGMIKCGGRRIKRSVLIDLNTIGFLTDEQKEELKKIDALKLYLEDKERILTNYNRKDMGDHPVNRRQLTNIGTFRAYLEAYLRNNQHIREDMTLIVRQLTPDEKGLPVELYCFTNDTDWKKHEEIQSDIFDHIFAVMPYFGLKPYQKISGTDIRTVNIK